jgi:sRNA-binding regulator protein Hfq
MDNLFISTEEQFFAALIANGGAVALYVVSGVKLSGQLVGATEFCVFLRKHDAASTLANTSMIFKSAIASVVPLAFGEPHRVAERDLHGVLSVNLRSRLSPTRTR